MDRKGDVGISVIVLEFRESVVVFVMIPVLLESISFMKSEVVSSLAHRLVTEEEMMLL